MVKGTDIKAAREAYRAMQARQALRAVRTGDPGTPNTTQLTQPQAATASGNPTTYAGQVAQAQLTAK